VKTNKNLYWILTILSTAGYAWIGFHLLYHPREENTFVLCLFKYTTGIPCPSCGTTRSLLLLLEGNIADAVLINPLGIIAAISLLVIPPWILADTLTEKKTLPSAFAWAESKITSQRILSLPLVVLAFLNWGWNILKGL